MTALLDDGAVVYLNGIELGRVNMNKGAVTSNTWALSRISGRGGYTSHYLYGDDTVINNGVNVLAIGRVAGIELNHVAQKEAEAGGPSVALKIEPANDSQRAIMIGRHFDASNLLYAHVSRASIDLLKESFRDTMTKDNWKTVIKLKGILGVETLGSSASASAASNAAAAAGGGE